MIVELVLLLNYLSSFSAQHLPTPDGVCEPGFNCKSERHCGRYLDLKDRLDRINETEWSDYHRGLATQVEELICNRAENGVCCKENVELTNGNIVRSVEDLPFIARLTIKTGYGTYAICGASLIDSQHLVTAKHCLETFWEECIEETDCVAFFRDLAVGPTNHEAGQFQIAITDIFEKEGRSDLAVVKLKHKVEEHKDYKLGTPLQTIKLASEEPQPGEKALTAGWGITGYNEDLSKELRSLELTVTEVPSTTIVPSTFLGQIIYVLILRQMTYGYTPTRMTRKGESQIRARATQEDLWP